MLTTLFNSFKMQEISTPIVIHRDLCEQNESSLEEIMSTHFNYFILHLLKICQKKLAARHQPISGFVSRHSIDSSIKMTDFKTSFDAITEVVGIQIYSFLRPKDLQSLSHTTRRFATEVREKLVRICMEVLPLEYVFPHHSSMLQQRMSFSNGHSFHSHDDFLDYIVGKVHDQGFLLRGTSTIEESFVDLRHAHNRNDRDIVLHQQGDENFEFYYDHTIREADANLNPNFWVGCISAFMRAGHVTKEWARCILSLEDIITVRSRKYKYSIDPMTHSTERYVYEEASIFISTPNEGEKIEIKLSTLYVGWM